MTVCRKTIIRGRIVVAIAALGMACQVVEPGLVLDGGLDVVAVSPDRSIVVDSGIVGDAGEDRPALVDVVDVPAIDVIDAATIDAARDVSPDLVRDAPVDLPSDTPGDARADAGSPGDTGGCGVCPERTVCRETACVALPVNCCVREGDCDDRDPRTSDRCNADSGSCEHVAIRCDAALACDDLDVCTDDSCSSTGTCTYAPISGCCHESAECTLGGYVCDATTHRCRIARPCTSTVECMGATRCSHENCVGGACVDAMPIPNCGCMGELRYDPTSPLGCYACDMSATRHECCGDADCDDRDPTTADRCDRILWSCTHAVRTACALP